jgi:hypothetical protein
LPGAVVAPPCLRLGHVLCVFFQPDIGTGYADAPALRFGGVVSFQMFFPFFFVSRLDKIKPVCHNIVKPV